ncbi:MAG: hypothetical protein RDU20_04960 [Desulfomonilaceae bacterium]|nr:hypothetical protein [Desulfomonilaceae bacterium]
MGMLALVAGCQEVNTAIDGLLGKRTPELSAAQKSIPLSVVPVKKRSAGEMPPTPGAVEKTEERDAPVGGLSAPPSQDRTNEVPAFRAEGKKRAPGPGTMAPRPKEEPAPVAPVAEKPVTDFVVMRDPFKAPTEVLPSQCPPSMPLCRFDRSQLKVVGVIQVEDGQFKGMVEDPDGRGYFITPGMQIGGATVTQVTNKGIMLHDAKSKQDVPMPLFLEAREAQEF